AAGSGAAHRGAFSHRQRRRTGDRRPAGETADQRRPACPDEPPRAGTDVEEEPADPERGDEGRVDPDRHPERAGPETERGEQPAEKEKAEQLRERGGPRERRQDRSRLREPRPPLAPVDAVPAPDRMHGGIHGRGHRDAGGGAHVAAKPPEKDPAEDRFLADADHDCGGGTEQRLPDRLRHGVAEPDVEPAEECGERQADGQSDHAAPEAGPEIAGRLLPPKADLAGRPEIEPPPRRENADHEEHLEDAVEDARERERPTDHRRDAPRDARAHDRRRPDDGGDDAEEPERLHALGTYVVYSALKRTYATDRSDASTRASPGPACRWTATSNSRARMRARARPSAPATGRPRRATGTPPIVTSTRSASIRMPASPAAMTRRPQFGSPP